MWPVTFQVPHVPDEDEARNLEERTGQRSAERIAIEQAGKIIRQARTWRELHTALATHGMRYEKKGSGAVPPRTNGTDDHYY